MASVADWVSLTGASSPRAPVLLRCMVDFSWFLCSSRTPHSQKTDPGPGGREAPLDLRSPSTIVRPRKGAKRWLSPFAVYARSCLFQGAAEK